MFGLNCYCLKLSTATCTTKKKNPSSIKIYQPKTLLAEKKNPSRNNHLYLNISKPIKKILISFSQ